MHVGDASATQLAATMQTGCGLQLREVTMAGCKALGDVGAIEIGDALADCESLQSLSLQGCVLLTDAAIAKLAVGVRTLSSKGLSGLEALDLGHHIRTFNRK